MVRGLAMAGTVHAVGVRFLTPSSIIAGRRAKQLLESLGEKYDVYELDQMDDGSDWQVSSQLPVYPAE